MKDSLGIIFAGMFLAMGVLAAGAHGGGALIINARDAGPYRISVWVNPPEPQINEPVHFTVGLSSPVDNAPILDADVSIEMKAKGPGRSDYFSPATTEQSVNKLFYEADLEIQEAGTYETVVTINGPAGYGEIRFETILGEKSKINWLIWGLLGLGLVLIFGLWRSRPGHKKRD